MKPVSLSKFYRLFYPQPTFIIMVTDGDEVAGLTATWVMPLSFQPPYAGAMVSPERYTYKVLKRSERFTINILDYSYADQVSFLGNVSKRFLKDKFERAGLHIVCPKEGVCHLQEASGYISCRREGEVRVGDHDLFIGKVEEAFADESFKDIWDVRVHKPLLYIGSKPGKGYGITRIFQTTGDRVEVKEPAIKEFYYRFEVEDEMERMAKKYEGNKLEHVSKMVARLVSMPEEDVRLILEERVRQGKIRLVL
jgi:flavin reductase (DIM6/NTAB) family NADH-FMN oxidoreductase RutF